MRENVYKGEHEKLGKLAKGCNWMFTINNPTRDEFEMLKRPINGIEFMCAQVEQGANATIHIQGYLETGPNGLKLREVEKRLGGRAWLGRRKGTQDQALAYVTKEDTRVVPTIGAVNEICGQWRWGTMKQQDKRDFKEKLQDKSVNFRTMVEDHPMESLKHLGNMQRMKEMQLRGYKRDKPTVRIYYGGTGVGKTLTANLKYPNAYTVGWPGKDGKWWWPFYDGEKEVILNEFRHQIGFNQMIQLLDRGNYMVEYKGGNTTVVAETYAITTNYHPKDWYKGVPDRSPLFRRLKEFAKVYVVTRTECKDIGAEYNDYRGMKLPFIINKTRWEVPDSLCRPKTSLTTLDEEQRRIAFYQGRTEEIRGPYGDPIQRIKDPNAMEDEVEEDIF